MAILRNNPMLVIAKNVGALTAANLLGRILNFAIVAIIARTAGSDGLGGYATANAISSFVLIFADGGLAARLTREAATDPSRTATEFARSMGVKTLTTFVVLVSLAGIFFVLPYEPWVRELFALLSISWILRSYTQIHHAVFRAREQMEFESLSILVQTAVFLAGAVSALLLGYPLVSIGWAAIVAALAQLAVSSAIVKRYVPIPFLGRPDPETLRDAAPYATTLFGYMAFAQCNIVILSLIASQALVGEFSSVSRILILASIFPQLINLAMMPASARVFGQDDRPRFRRLTTASLRILLILGGAGAVLLVCLSKWIMRWIYGEELGALYPLLQIGSLYLVVQFTSGILGMALTSAGRQTARARAVLIALASAVVFLLALTPTLGVLGAVLALILSEFVLVIAEAIPAWDLVDPGDLFRNAAWAFAAGALAVAAHFALVSAAQPWLAIAAPPLLYGVLLLPSGEIGKLFDLVKHRR